MREIELIIRIDLNIGACTERFTEIDPTTTIIEGKLNEFCSELDRMKLGFITAEMNVDGKSWSRNE